MRSIHPYEKTEHLHLCVESYTLGRWLYICLYFSDCQQGWLGEWEYNCGDFGRCRSRFRFVSKKFRL